MALIQAYASTAQTRAPNVDVHVNVVDMRTPRMAMVATAIQRSKFPKATLGSKRIYAPNVAEVEPLYPTPRSMASRRFLTMCNSSHANEQNSGWEALARLIPQLQLSGSTARGNSGARQVRLAPDDQFRQKPRFGGVSVCGLQNNEPERHIDKHYRYSEHIK